MWALSPFLSIPSLQRPQPASLTKPQSPSDNVAEMLPISAALNEQRLRRLANHSGLYLSDASATNVAADL